MSVAVLVSGLVYLWGAERGVRTLVYLLKPGTMALMIGIALWGAVSRPGVPYGWLVLIGLLCSVAGDIFLMLPKERFLAGLSAFLLAHLCYLAAFWYGLPWRPTAVEGLIGLALLTLGAAMFGRLRRSLRERGRRALVLPVGLYILVISAMVWSAARSLTAGPGVPFSPPLVTAGALLFYLSDAALAWDKFVRPLPRRHLLVMGAYFTAQYFIAISAGGAA